MVDLNITYSNIACYRSLLKVIGYHKIPGMHMMFIKYFSLADFALCFIIMRTKDMQVIPANYSKL